MTKFEQVANIFDLELEDRFCLTFMGDIRFFFAKNGLCVDPPFSIEDMNMEYILYNMLNGHLTIIKKYYIPSFNSCGYEEIDLSRLDKGLIDKYKKYNLLSSSADEAKTLSDKILDVLR